MTKSSPWKQFFRKAGAMFGHGVSLLLKSASHNLGLKILAIIFSIILCNVIITQSNPTRRTTVNNVPITFTGLETLRQNNLTLSMESAQKVMTATVSLNVRLQEMSRVSADRVTATADLAMISQPGVYDIGITVTSGLGAVFSRNPEKISVTVERLISKTVPVIIKTVGEMPDGYSISSSSLTPNYVVVTGPESVVGRVYEAIVTADVSKQNTDLTGSQPFVLEDDKGNGIANSGLELSNYGVVVDMKVNKTVTLPVNAALSLVGADALPDGYDLANVEVFPATVNVTGSEDALSRVTELSCDTIDITHMTGSKTFTVHLKPVSGVTMETTQVEVVVRVEPKIVTRTFHGLKVDVINVAEGLQAPVLTDTLDVVITGPQSVVSAMNKQSIELVVDAKGLIAGTHQMAVNVVLDTDFKDKISAGNILLSPNEVTFTLVNTP